MDHHTIDRRAALLAGLASSAALAMPGATSFASERDPDAALLALVSEWQAAYVRMGALGDAGDEDALDAAFEAVHALDLRIAATTPATPHGYLVKMLARTCFGAYEPDEGWAVSAALITGFLPTLHQAATESAEASRRFIDAGAIRAEA